MSIRGIVTVCFGQDYEKLACAVHVLAQRYTSLPWFVVTNCPLDTLSKGWRSDTVFKVFERPQHHNRNAKLNLDSLSPFDESLYIDCDAVIQKKGIGRVFKLLDGVDMVFDPLMLWKEGDRIVRIYIKTMKMFGVEPPIQIYSGGIFAFRKTENTERLFAFWREYWRRTGEGREMPALNCAIANSGVTLAQLPFGFFSACTEDDNAVVQHDYSGNFQKKFNLPTWKSFKPFDKDPTDWKWEDWSWEPEV